MIKRRFQPSQQSYFEMRAMGVFDLLDSKNKLSASSDMIIPNAAHSSNFTSPEAIVSASLKILENAEEDESNIIGPSFWDDLEPAMAI